MRDPLDFSGRASRPLDFSQRGTRLDRSAGQRAGENIIDGGWRSGLGAVRRSADPQADGLFNLKDLTRVRPGSPLDWALDRTIGEEREWGAADETVPTLGAVVTGQGLRGTPAAAAEDARRDRYDARAGADPISNPGDAIAYFGGQVIGGAPSPENWIGGGAGRAAYQGARPLLNFAARAAGRFGEQAAVAAGTDVALQLGDIGAGVEDRYSVNQTLLAAGVGGVVGGTVDMAAPYAGRAASTARQGVADFSSRASGAVRNVARDAAARTQGAITNPVPSFDGPSMDVGASIRPREAMPSPLGEFGQPRRPSRPAPTPEPAQGVLFAPPVTGPVSSGFGPRTRPNRRASANHQGVDFAVAEGTPVAASADGEVVFAGPRGNYGNRVVIRHADGSETAYSHLSGFDVRVGDSVRAGQAVAQSGSTGNVTGPHLHFEIRRGGGYVDPRPLLNGETPRTPRGPDDRGDRRTLAEDLDRQRSARATAPTAERLSPDPLIDRFPNTRPEEAAAAREAVLDPAAAGRLRAMLGERFATPREARVVARAMVHEARRSPLAESAPARPAERLAMFAGERARTAPTDTLASAQARYASGEDMETVRRDTGWFPGDEGQWRYEISDHAAAFPTAPRRDFFGPRQVGLARLNELARGAYGVARLNDIISHPDLFAAYPKLARVGVMVDRIPALAQFDGDTIIVSPRALADPEALRGILLHEIQHGVQRIEGFAPGASASARGLEAGGYGADLNARRQELRSRGYMADSAVGDVYRRSAGEIEARNTADRRDLTDAGRRKVSPDATRDIPDTDAIVPDGFRNPRGKVLAESAFNPAKPFTVEDGAAPARLAARAAGEPGPDFSARSVGSAQVGGLDFAARATPQRLAVDMSGYAGRIGQAGQAAQTVQSGGQSVGGLRDAPRPDAVARGQGQAFGGKTVSDLAADLRTALGLTHRQGRVGARKALGTYDTGSGVVRTKAVDELDVLAHEATHALEYERKGPALAAALAAHDQQLKALAYPGAAKAVQREEGFAEFGRWYLTNPDHARRIAPDFFDAFEAAMKVDAPEVLAGMQAVQSGYQNLLKSSSIDVAKGSIAYTGSKGPVGDLFDAIRRTGPGSTLRRVVDDIYTAVIDDLHPLSIAERKLSNLYLANNGQKLDLKRAASPYALARLSREAYAAGHNDLMNGVTPYHGLDPEGASLADALETAGIEVVGVADLKNPLNAGRQGRYKPGATREFDAYLISRRMVHEWDRYSAGDLPNPPDRNTKAFHEQVIADAEAAHPTWAKAAGQVYEFLTNLWRKEFEAGLIKPESYNHGLTAHPDYVPLMRDMSDKGPGKAGKPRGALQFAGGVKAFEGSSRDIISPLSSIMRRAYELNAIVKRNDVMIALDDLAHAAGRGSGAIVERLPAKEIEAFTVSAADALQKTADELGLSGRDLSTMQKFADDAAANDATLTLFKQTEFSPRKGEAVVFVWRDGQKTPLLLPDGDFGKQMFDSLAGMNKQLQNVVVEGMAAATQLLRYGVTLSPEFMSANIVRDSLATFINTDVGFVPVLDTIRGGALELAQGRTARRYANAGGMRGGANVAATQKPFPKTDAEAEAQLQHLRRKGWKVKRFASWRGIAELTDLSETSTRIGVFAKGFERAKRRGLNDYEAMIESGFTSRDYLDFARRGSKMLTASRIVTFLNAALQGTEKSIRVLTAGGNLKAVLTPLSKEARTPSEKRALAHAYKAWAKIMTLGAFGLGLRMLYADDPEYEEINDRLRATHWIAKIGGRWVFVPKPFELATASNIAERAYEGTILKDPTAGERLLSDFRHTIAPPSEIPALAVPFHIASNRDYLGRPIVPDHLRGTVDPELQFNSYTSDLGKLIGQAFNVSPAVVDYTITGFGGSLGRYALQGSNLAGEAVTGRPRTAAGPEDMFLARRFTRSIARGSDSQSEFWDNVSRDGGEMTRAEGSFRALMRDAKDQEAAAYLNGLPPHQRAYVIAKVFSEDGESVMHPLVRTQKAIAAVGDFRSDLRGGELRDGQGQVIPLTPEDRRAIDNAVGDFALAEMRNALIDTGVRGWAQRDRMDPSAALRRIWETSPEAYNQLGIRLTNEKAATAVHPAEQQRRQAQWAEYRPRLEQATDPAFVVGQMRTRRTANGDRTSRYREAQRRAGGAYAPPANALAGPTTAAPRNALSGG